MISSRYFTSLSHFSYSEISQIHCHINSLKPERVQSFESLCKFRVNFTTVWIKCSTTSFYSTVSLPFNFMFYTGVIELYFFVFSSLVETLSMLCSTGKYLRRSYKKAFSSVLVGRESRIFFRYPNLQQVFKK